MRYQIFREQEDQEWCDFDDLKHLIKDYYLIEISNDNGNVIRQYKDVPVTVNIDGKDVKIEYGDLYMTEGGIGNEHYTHILKHMHTDDELKAFLKLADIKYDCGYDDSDDF